MEEYDIVITEQAESDLDEVVNFIREHWSESIKTDFLSVVSDKMRLLTSMPYMYQASATQPDVRACRLNKQITMYYRIVESAKTIEVLSFRDNRRDNQ